MKIRLPESPTVISELSFALIPVSYLFGFSVSSPAISTPLPVLLPTSEPLSKFPVSSFLLSSAPCYSYQDSYIPDSPPPEHSLQVLELIHQSFSFACLHFPPIAFFTNSNHHISITNDADADGIIRYSFPS